MATATYMTTEELASKLRYDARYIREYLKDSVLLEGVHYFRPFGRRKILYKASASGDIPEQIIGLFDEADCIALVDSAKNSLTHFAAGKAMEAVVSSGQTRKLALVFTHMDAVVGPNLKGKARIDHVFGGVRNRAAILKIRIPQMTW